MRVRGLGVRVWGLGPGACFGMRFMQIVGRPLCVGCLRDDTSAYPELPNPLTEEYTLNHIGEPPAIEGYVPHVPYLGRSCCDNLR